MNHDDDLDAAAALQEPLRGTPSENSPAPNAATSGGGGSGPLVVDYNSTEFRKDDLEGKKEPSAKKENVIRKLSMQKLLPKIKAPAVELQIETASRWSARMIFTIWYVVLLLALILQSIITLQWDCRSICDQQTCSLGDVTSFASNQCANGTNLTIFGEGDPTGGAKDALVVWRGGFTSLFDSKLNRYVNLVFTMPRPNSTTSFGDELKLHMRFRLNVHGLNETKEEREEDFNNFLYELAITCPAHEKYCDTVFLPATTSNINNNSHILLSVTDITGNVADAAMNASIGAVFQKAEYTIATISLRYIFFVISTLHFIRFLYHKKFSFELYEQSWIIILHVGLILYLNPLFAACVYIKPEGQFLSWLEFRIPTYFIALLVSFMFALITSSMAWSHDSNTYHPPIGAKIAAYTFVLLIIILDVVDASEKDWNWSEEHCPDFQCGPVGYTMYSCIALGILICTVWLRWLRNNLGKKQYLSSRPQQLAVRLFIFLFTTLVIYFILQALVVLWWYRGVSSIVTYQSLLQVGPIIVAFTFVQLMTYAYTTTIRTNSVPIHPTDSRWKRRVWPTAWFQWVSLHGGSMYIFFSEAEQERFNNLQLRYMQSPELYESQAETVLECQTESEVDYDSGEDDDVPDCEFLVEYPEGGAPVEKEKPANPPSPRSPRRGRSRTMTSRLREAKSSASSTMDKVQGTVGHFLVDKPAELMEKLENKVNDKLVGNRHKPFFNLETAVDCFNLSWEVYGNKGDTDSGEGYQIEIQPFAVLENIPVLGKCCGCCFKKHEEEEGLPDGTIRHEESYAFSPTGRHGSIFSDANSVTGSPTAADSPTRSRAVSTAPPPPPIDVEQYGYDRIDVFEEMDVQVVIAQVAPDVGRHREKEPRIVIAFRGTDNINNAKQDAMIRRVQWSEMEATMWETATISKPEVHFGFLSVWNALRERVMNVVRSRLEALGGEHQIVCTGHSLGGALATLCSYVMAKYLKKINHACPNVQCYTYGMPRVGNSAFKHHYNKMVPDNFRIVNESDAVSTLSILGGSHVGIEVAIDRHGNFITEPMFIEKVFRPTKGKGSAIAHHSMTAYGDSLNAVAECGLGWCPSRCLVPYCHDDEKEMLLARQPKVDPML